MIPALFPIFDKTPRKIIEQGNSRYISVPNAYEVAKELEPARFKAIVLNYYLAYYPTKFEMSKKRQLLDIAMTALEALATIDSENKESIEKAWKVLKELEDVYELED